MFGDLYYLIHKADAFCRESKHARLTHAILIASLFGSVTWLLFKAHYRQIGDPGSVFPACFGVFVAYCFFEWLNHRDNYPRIAPLWLTSLYIRGVLSLQALMLKGWLLNLVVKATTGLSDEGCVVLTVLLLVLWRAAIARMARIDERDMVLILLDDVPIGNPLIGVPTPGR